MKFLRKQLLVPIALMSGLGILALAALMPIPERLTTSPVVRHCFDALHLPLFAMAAAVVLWFFLIRQEGRSEGKRNGGRIALLVALVFVGIAGLVEVIQPFTGRSASMRDFLYGGLGTVVGVWWMSRRRTWIKRESLMFWLMALASVVVVGWPVFLAAQHSRQLAKMFPQLLVGDVEVDREFWHAEGGAEIEELPSAAIEGESALVITTSPKQWSGVIFRPSAAAMNWTERKNLVLQISTDGQSPFVLGLKIEDFDSSDHSTRYNHSISLTGGRQEVRIALRENAAELVDLQRVKRLALFVSDKEPVRSFVIERAFLE